MNMLSTNPQTFDFQGHQIHIIHHGDDILFNANDVCEALGFGNPYQALKSHVDEGDVLRLDTYLSRSDTGNTTTRSINYVNESGLYCLSFGSNKPEAKKFKLWVTREVLPTIRKTGSYTHPKARQTLYQKINAHMEVIDKSQEEIRSLVAEVLDQSNDLVLKKNLMSELEINSYELKEMEKQGLLKPIQTPGYKSPRYRRSDIEALKDDALIEIRTDQRQQHQLQF